MLILPCMDIAIAVWGVDAGAAGPGCWLSIFLGMDAHK